MISKQSFYATPFILWSIAAYSAPANIPFPSAPGDKGSYVIIDISRSGAITKTTHKRSGPSGISFTKAEINCATLQFREMGNVDDDLSKMRIRPSKWTEFVSGSSKHKLAIAACSHQL